MAPQVPEVVPADIGGLASSSVLAERGPVLERARERRRWFACLVAALALHVGTSLWRAGSQDEASVAVVRDASTEAISVGLDEQPAGSGQPPGGGSPEPEPTGRVSTPEQPVPSPKPAPKVQRNAVAKEAPAVTETPEGEAVEDLAPDLLAAAEGEPSVSVRPKAQRKQLLEPSSRASAASPEAAEQTRAASNALGTGFGQNGGPGGMGRGNGGVITERFAFGGPKGAFRADVCFIEPETVNLKSVTSCPRVTSFYADALDVSPRRFTEGFPGVGDRTEWFAIQYRGKFQVETADVYTFRLLSDDGSILHIDGYPIIDNDGRHPPRSKEATIQLEAGEHDFYVFYYQGHPDLIALQLFVKQLNHGERLFGPRI